jgi:predicted nucleic acid-binding protein
MITGYHAGYVVDASVAVKWFIREREQDREAALNLRGRHIQGQTRMIVPELFLLEVPNAVKAGRKGTEEELDQVLKTLMDLDLQVERHSETVLRKTNAVAWAYNMTWYDAVYVALAEILGFPCVTADDALLRKMKGHSIVIHLKDLGFTQE